MPANYTDLDDETTARFWQSVDKNGPRAPWMADRCWTWTGRTGSGGSSIFWSHGHVLAARRVSWALSGRPLVDAAGRPLTLYVLCNNRACVRPGHLVARTARQAPHPGACRSIVWQPGPPI